PMPMPPPRPPPGMWKPPPPRRSSTFSDRRKSPQRMSYLPSPAAPACTGRPTSIARRAAPANDRPRHAMAAVRAALVVAFALLQLAAEGPVHEDRVAEDHGQERQGADQEEYLRRRHRRRVPHRQRRRHEI